jgi:1,4-dihydroxy-2-naphthoyl-CoA hydrolase
VTEIDATEPDAVLAMVNASPGWAREMGIFVVKATVEEVVATLEIGPKHLQAYGIVHGGVHAGIIETLTSIGAALVALPRGQRVVGLENSTSFVRAVRSGTLTATARPVTRGRTTQVWDAEVRDSEDKVAATGRVRLLCLDQERAL